jgi:hypothetical protein
VTHQENKRDNFPNEVLLSPNVERQASEKASRISITFARMLAIAQYEAATSSFPGEDERVKTLEKTTLHPSTVWQRKRAEKRDQVCV